MLLKLGKFQTEVADRQAIGDCISLYARGVDRADAELLTEVFWEDAKIRGELYSGGPAQFVAIIRINGDRAAAESYFYGYHVGHAGSPFDLIISGRYLDRFDKRGDEWRISEKTIIFEWQREFPDSGGSKPGPMGSKVGLKGEPAPNDPSYSLFRSID